MSYPLQSKDDLTKLAKHKGLQSWEELTAFIRTLPYGRNKDRSNFGLVLSEEKGTCSSKHALLKRIADLNEIPDVKLILGIYKMNQSNTPNIGNVLLENGLSFIPEAHCYLKIKQKRIDFTNAHSDISKIQDDIMEELEIEPGQVVKFKVDYHKSYLKKWLKETNSGFTFDALWKLRERCIENLSE